MIMLELTKDDANILDLTKAVPELKQLRGVLKWNPHPVNANCPKSGFDLDIFVYSLNAAGKIESAQDVVYFKNKQNVNGSISVPFDNQTGSGDEDEYVFIDIENLPQNRQRFELFVFIHEATKRNQNFGMISESSFDMINEETGEVMVRYRMTEYGAETALHIGSLVRAGSNFEFHPVGLSASADPNDVARAYC